MPDFRFAGLHVLVWTLLVVSLPSLSAEDWNQFRGPRRDNISPDTGLLEEWPEQGPNLFWSATGLGEGYSTVALAGNHIYSMGKFDESEFVVALDRSTGSPAWKTRIGHAYHNGMGDGPRGTPTVVDGRVYALGAMGDLACCSADSGDIVWTRNILEDFRGNNITWGISESVLLDEGRLICTPGGKQGTVVALDPNNGETIWVSRIPGAPNAGYASVVPSTVGSIRQYIVFTSKGVAGVRADDGTPLWGENKSSNGTANCATPLVIGREIYCSSDYGTGAELIRLTAQGNKVQSDVVYFNRNMKNHHGGMVHVDGYVYGSSSSILTCIDLKSGEATWRERGMKGSVAYADGKIVFRHENGRVVLLEANPREYLELGRFQQPDRSKRRAWAHPVIADGRLFLRDQDSLLVYDLTGS